jgi:hypothetical protein
VETQLEGVVISIRAQNAIKAPLVAWNFANNAIFCNLERIIDHKRRGYNLRLWAASSSVDNLDFA